MGCAKVLKCDKIHVALLAPIEVLWEKSFISKYVVGHTFSSEDAAQFPSSKNLGLKLSCCFEMPDGVLLCDRSE